MKKLLFIFCLVLSVKLYAQSEYTTGIVYPAGYQIGDYVEFLRVVPIDAGASGMYEISISYTRGNVAAAATHIASISHANPNVWREVGRQFNNPYVVAGNINFTVDCNTEYANPRFRIRAVNTIGDNTPIEVHIKVRSINFNSSWESKDVRGNDLSVDKYLPMTNDWNLYVGNTFQSGGANLAIKAIENGNVGIAVANPKASLHVNGIMRWGGDATNYTYSGQDGSGAFIEQVGSNDAQSKLRLQSSKAGDGANYNQFFIDPVNGFSFMTLGNGNGNVGIGTSTPQEKLSVKGKIRAQEIKVEMTGWSDFVFAKEYKLPSLADVEKYIKANNHLPEIPSAKEVEAEGVSLGEMNKKLLQKIEELTLYLIEQKKEISELRQEVKELKKK